MSTGLSFTGCLHILQGAGLPECDSTTPQRLEEWYQLLLEELAPREDRAAPQPSQPPCGQTQDVQVLPRNAPEHRGRPPLRKRFAETVFIYLTSGSMGLRPRRRATPA